jgi:ribose transport system substrate-binding protein
MSAIDHATVAGIPLPESAAYGLLGKDVPAFVVAPAMTITRANLAAGYLASLHRDRPASVLKALGE